MSSHSKALQTFARKLALLLILRRTMQWTTVWLFSWGVVVLAARFTGTVNQRWLLIGALGFVPLAFAATLYENRRRVAFARVRATYDGLNRCGGIIMAEEAADISAWREALPPASTPSLRWHGGRSLTLLTVSVAFLAITLGLPDRLTAFAPKRPLEIGKLVGELHAEVQTLKQEKILDDKKADDLQKQMERLKEQASGLDPARTWEALDHIKESNADLARRAAEEALSKVKSLTEAQTLASALKIASDGGGMTQDTATQAAQDLAGMLKSAQLETGLLNGAIPPELLSQLSKLSKEDLSKLLEAIQASKSGLGRTITNLANLKMIDAKMLSQCQGAGQCNNTNALAAFLCQSTNQCNLAALAQSFCRGGIDRGRGDAPMTWKEETSAEGAKFKEEALPASSQMNDSKFVGVTRSAPELAREDLAVEPGALANARAGGGSANSQVILPRHKQTVQRFFKREE